MLPEINLDFRAGAFAFEGIGSHRNKYQRVNSLVTDCVHGHWQSCNVALQTIEWRIRNAQNAGCEYWIAGNGFGHHPSRTVEVLGERGDTHSHTWQRGQFNLDERFKINWSGCNHYL